MQELASARVLFSPQLPDALHWFLWRTLMPLKTFLSVKGSLSLSSLQSVMQSPSALALEVQQPVPVQPQTFAVPPPPQVFGVEQVPQLSEPPQPSGIVPQFLPCAVQVVGVQPQTFAVPPPPQVFGAMQVPQLSDPVQPSEMVPQFLPCAAQVVGVQGAAPHTLAVVPPQIWGAVQVPQLSEPPQPSGIVPQFLPWIAHVVGVQPQTLAVPPPPQI
jgi:hypothetical protein